MTQYWFKGEKLKLAEQEEAAAATPTGVNAPSEGQDDDEEEDPDSLDISVVNQDTLMDPILKAIAEDEAGKVVDKHHPEERWILIELDMNQADDTVAGSDALATSKAKKEVSAKNKEEKQNVELVVNLYGTSSDSSSSHLDSPNGAKGSCPVGSFDCNMDGLQCIPNSLRQVPTRNEGVTI